MVLHKVFASAVLTGAVVLCLGAVPSQGAEGTPVDDLPLREPDFGASGVQGKRDIPEGWVPIDAEEAAESLRAAQQNLAEFPTGMRSHDKAAIGEIWIQYPTSGGLGSGTPDGSSGSLPVVSFGHAAIVDRDEGNGRRTEQTIEAYPGFASPTGQDGVHRYWDNWKRNPEMMRGRIALLGARNSNLSKRTGARDFARAQIGKPYSVFASKADYSSFYCSKLVWAAWRSQGYDFDYNGGFWVLPMDLVNSSGTVILWRNK